MNRKLNPFPTRVNWAVTMLLAFAGTGLRPAWSQAFARESPSLIELFTSQGCSSCPPAENVLNTWGMDLFKAGKALPLAFHVDYWDNIGWKDPFSSPLFTARQRDYAGALGDSSLYTPEMVVGGRVGFVGSDLSRAKKEMAVSAGPSARLSLACRLTPDGLAVRTTASFSKAAGPGPSPKLYAVVFENGLSTNVLSGENKGRNLTENFVVRDLSEIEAPEKAGSYPGRAVIHLESFWIKDHLGVAVFAQDQTTQKILGVRWIYPVTGK